jgi:hypothetical protein
MLNICLSILHASCIAKYALKKDIVLLYGVRVDLFVRYNGKSFLLL